MGSGGLMGYMADDFTDYADGGGGYVDTGATDYYGGAYYSGGDSLAPDMDYSVPPFGDPYNQTDAVLPGYPDYTDTGIDSAPLAPDYGTEQTGDDGSYYYEDANGWYYSDPAGEWYGGDDAGNQWGGNSTGDYWETDTAGSFYWEDSSGDWYLEDASGNWSSGDASGYTCSGDASGGFDCSDGTSSVSGATMPSKASATRQSAQQTRQQAQSGASGAQRPPTTATSQPRTTTTAPRQTSATVPTSNIGNRAVLTSAQPGSTGAISPWMWIALAGLALFALKK